MSQCYLWICYACKFQSTIGTVRKNIRLTQVFVAQPLENREDVGPSGSVDVRDQSLGGRPTGPRHILALDPHRGGGGQVQGEEGTWAFGQLTSGFY